MTRATEIAAPVPADDRTEAVDGSPTGSRARWRRLLGSDIAATGVLAVGWQLALTVLGVLAERVLLSVSAPARGPAPPAPSLLSHTFRWDSFWIAGILDGSYVQKPQSAAFYPLFPLLVKGVDAVTLGTLGLLGAALLINTLALWAALHALLRIAGHVLPGPERRWLLPVALLCAPTAYYLHVFYSEAVFVGLGFAAYRWALDRRWTLMGLCLVPLTASRVTAVLVVGLCFLEFWRSRSWRPSGLLSWPVLWFPGAFAGFAAYALTLRALTGDGLGMFTAYRIEPSWSYTHFQPDIPSTLAHAGGVVVDAFASGAPVSIYVVVDQLLPLVGVAAVLALSAYLGLVVRGAGVPLALYGLATTVMVTLNGNLVAVHRYLLPVVGVYVAVALLVERGGVARAVAWGGLYVSVLAQAVLYALFAANIWVG